MKLHRLPWVTFCLLSASAFAQDDTPNVVLIITDDVGYGDIGVYGAPDIRTPSIDSLARDGVMLTDFYSNGPVCSPTRAALLTGRYQQRVAIQRPVQRGQRLPVSETELQKLLQDNGYRTGLVGKWHLGYEDEVSPTARGFDYFFGFRAGYSDYWEHTNNRGEPDLWENDIPVTVEGYLTDIFTEQSVAFIERNAGRRFFLEVAYNAAHWPWQVPGLPSAAIDNARKLNPEEAGANSREDYVAMMESADAGVGEILAAIERSGIAENTIVIFTNDNGGEWLSRNLPLFNRKGTLWEGGIRVPAIVRWPGVLPAGRESTQVGITMDLSASILAATNTPLPSEARYEGMNLFPILSGEQPEVERTLFWRYPVGEQGAVRSGNWKLLVQGSFTYLFDLGSDIGERVDLTYQHRDVVRQLTGLLKEWEADVDAEAEANGTVLYNRRD